jgi:hypothetical protein
MVCSANKGREPCCDTEFHQPENALSPIDSRVEMFQRGQRNDAFFNMKALAPRPMSEATEIFDDTDFEDDDSDVEDNSPRLSVNSVGVLPSLRRTIY